MPSCDFLELSDILFVSSLRKNLLSVSCMTDIHWKVVFERKQCTINYSLACPKTLARAVREGSLYRLFVNQATLTHSNERLVGPSVSQKAHVETSFDPCTLIVRSFNV